jgi:hypothetical protein
MSLETFPTDWLCERLSLDAIGLHRTDSVHPFRRTQPAKGEAFPVTRPVAPRQAILSPWGSALSSLPGRSRTVARLPPDRLH